MDAMLATFIAVFLAEIGDRSQILTAALALRYHNNKAVLAGLMLATVLNCSLSAALGSRVDDWVSDEPLRLFMALAYIFAGAGMLVWRRPVDILTQWKFSAFGTSFAGLFILQFGDKSQFIIAAHAANSPVWGFAWLGGSLGVLAACIPALYLRERLADIVPLNLIRKIAGTLLLLGGIFLALGALALISP
jgi:Ca2+/H+ antiporter, TMEM165/GDT1 family